MRPGTLPCALCGDPVDVTAQHYRRIHGWERPRRGGGTNQVTLRVSDPKTVACDGCIRRRKQLVDDDQAPLAVDPASVDRLARLEQLDVPDAHTRRKLHDLEIVVRDQRRYIATLEEQLRPGLVQPIGVQEGLAL